MPPIELPSTFTLDDFALLLGLALMARLAYLVVRRLLAPRARSGGSSG